jgi:hypothetical protein
MEPEVNLNESAEKTEVKERKKPGPKPKPKLDKAAVETAEKADLETTEKPEIETAEKSNPNVDTAEPVVESSVEVVNEPETNEGEVADNQADEPNEHLPVGSIIATHGRAIVIHKYANLSDIGIRHSGVVRVVENNNGVCWVRYMVSGFGPCMGYIHEDKLNKYMK